MADSDPNLSRCFIVCGKSAEVRHPDWLLTSRYLLLVRQAPFDTPGACPGLVCLSGAILCRLSAATSLAAPRLWPPTPYHVA